MAHDRRRIGSRSALSLVEVAAILSVIGMLLAVAIPTLARSLRASKVSEASEQLDHLYRSIAAYYATARPDANGNDSFCLPDAAGPAPILPAPTPVAVDFAAPATPGAATWSALGFTPKMPLRYRYTLVVPSPGCRQAAAPHPNRLVLRAEGDLDADGVYSTFERRADVLPHGELSPDPVLHIEDRIE
ncbi:MAG TPA: type II secretion system protein [Polyangiales bacterium]